MKKVISVGFTVDKKKGYVTGLAMMHELFLSVINDSGYKAIPISLNPKNGSNCKVGSISVRRIFEYVYLVLLSIGTIICNPKSIFNTYPSTTRGGFYRDLLFVIIAKICGDKIVLQQFGALFNDFRLSLRKPERFLMKFVFSRVDAIFVEGDFAKKQFEFLKKNIVIPVPNGLPELIERPSSTSKKINPDSVFCLLFMNNMIESKGYMDVLEAIDILVNKRKKNIRALFAGRFMKVVDDTKFSTVEDAEAWFEDFVNCRGLSKHVEYRPGIFDQDKVDAFNHSHVFLLPSYYKFEGQPTAILEALSYGCVPIVTKYRLIPEMVNEKCACFVQARNPECIADVVEQLIDNPDYYNKLSEAGIDRYENNYTKKKYQERVIKILGNL